MVLRILRLSPKPTFGGSVVKLTNNMQHKRKNQQCSQKSDMSDYSCLVAHWQIRSQRYSWKTYYELLLVTVLKTC